MNNNKNLVVAVLGAGIIGRGIIANLQKKYSLRLYNRTKKVLDGIARKEDVICYTPLEAAEGAHIVISVVKDDEASKEVWFGLFGAIHKIDKGTICLECSTLSIDYIDIWAHKLKISGVFPIDSPLTGSKSGAELGTLTLFVGGEKRAIEEAQPVLRCISQKLHHLGSTGMGMRFKLVYNMLSGTILVSLAEAFGLASSLDLNLEQVYQVLVQDDGWAQPVTRGKGDSMIKGTHTSPSFYLEYLYKDLIYALSSANELQQPTPIAETVRETLHYGVENGLGKLDMSSISDIFLKRGSVHG